MSRFACFQAYTYCLLIAEWYTLHGTRLNFLDLISSEIPSLADSAATMSLLISRDVSFFSWHWLYACFTFVFSSTGPEAS